MTALGDKDFNIANGEKINNYDELESTALRTKLRTGTKNFYETKPQRAMYIDDIQLAVLPEGIDEDITQVLEDNGVKYITYQKGTDADATRINRVKAIKEFLANNPVEDSNIRYQYDVDEMFKEDRYYSRQIDKWENLDTYSYITVGKIKEGSPLNQIGMKADNLYFDVSKIKKSMDTHSDHLTKTVLKGIPKLLNNPIVIVEYNVGSNSNTANVYGNLYYKGTPITVGIVATLSRGKTVISKVRTVHARQNFAKQITDASVLYLGENKKETDRWFQAQRQLSVPMRGTKYGFIRSIYDSPSNVNTKNLQISPDSKKQYAGETSDNRTILANALKTENLSDADREIINKYLTNKK